MTSADARTGERRMRRPVGALMAFAAAVAMLTAAVASPTAAATPSTAAATPSTAAATPSTAAATPSTAAATPMAASPTARAGEVEAVYAGRGPAATVTERITDAAGRPVVVHRPADLGPPGTRHPVLTWGHGTGGSPATYTALLDHLASWDVVVVATGAERTARGEEMLAAARAVVALDTTPGAALAGHVDRGHVAAGGHSQGAGGTVNAAIRAPELITTAVPVALPQPLLVGPGDGFDVAAVRVPTLYLGGDADVIAPVPSQRAYHRRTGGPAVTASLRGGGHTEVEGDGGAMRGYLTAWLRARLHDDSRAARAVEGPGPELARDPAWTAFATRGPDGRGGTR